VFNQLESLSRFPIPSLAYPALAMLSGHVIHKDSIVFFLTGRLGRPNLARDVQAQERVLSEFALFGLTVSPPVPSQAR
jgi:hypothetical protein